MFRTKYFHVEGENAHPLIWKGFGFELHLPEHTFLPKEECCIRVDAVIGGDFDIPEGVEPVSAIYVISVTTKLCQLSLLKIQHCVDLDRAHPDSGLSFYRASYKESSPPYRFKCVPGGRFDVLNKYGVLELPVFCAKFIGKDQGLTIVWKGMTHPPVDWVQLWPWIQCWVRVLLFSVVRMFIVLYFEQNK